MHIIKFTIKKLSLARQFVLWSLMIAFICAFFYSSRARQRSHAPTLLQSQLIHVRYWICCMQGICLTAITSTTTLAELKKKKQFLISCLDFVHCKMAPAQIRLHRFLILNLNLSFFPESCRWLRNEWQIEGITSGQNQSEQESGWHFLMRWSKRSYSCSLGFISGSYEGHRIPRSDPLCLSSRGTDDHFLNIFPHMVSWLGQWTALFNILVQKVLQLLSWVEIWRLWRP